MPPGAPTLRELRRATADRVAPYELATTGVAQSDGLGGAVYVGVDRSNSRRRVISTDLASLSADGQYAETPPDYLKNEWVLLCTTPLQQRRIPESGYAGAGTIETVAAGYDPALVSSPTDPCAYIDVERPFLSLVAPGIELEIHGIPPLRGGKSAGLHTHINHALRVKLREDEVVVPTVAGQTEVDVTASFPWLTMPALFRDAMYPTSVSGVQVWPIPGARLRFDGDRALLTGTAGGYGSVSPIPVRVLRPVSSWIKVASTGVWAESVVGLVDDDDQCLGDLDELSLIAAFHVADAEGRACIVGSPEQVFWQGLATTFATRLPSMRDQRTQSARRATAPWPDFTSVDGPYGGRWGPGFR